MTELEIKSWKGFLARNKEIEDAIEMASNDIFKIVKDLDDMYKKIDKINTNPEFQKLKDKECLKFSETNINRLNEKAQNLIDGYTLKANKVLGVLMTAEYLIDQYNKGLYVEGDENEILSNILNATNKSCIFWVIAAATEDRCKALSVLFNVSANRIDSYEEGAYGVGKATENFIKSKITEPLLQKRLGVAGSLKTISVAAIAAGLFTYFKDRITDKGEWRELDEKRAKLHAIQNGVDFAAWEIAFLLAGGGLSGGLIAAGATIAVDQLASIVVGEVTGDVVVEEIKGKDCLTGKDTTYTIYRNGGGPDGTYDVYKEVCVDANEKYEIDGRIYTKENYKIEVYKDWKKTKIQEKEALISSPEDAEAIDNSLKRIRNAKNITEAKEEIELFKTYNPNATSALEREDFDLEEYYSYHHPEENLESGGH